MLRFLVERIIAMNGFGCPVSSLASHKSLRANEKAHETPYQSCGIWRQASYINHSCLSTARRSFIGDMMIVRATRDLEPGTEITFWYHSPFNSNSTALKDKFKHWGFICDCPLCSDANKTKASMVTKRENLSKHLERAFVDARGCQTDKAERLLEELNATYPRPADEVPRLLLWGPQLLLTRVYAEQKSAIKTLDSARRALASLGFIVMGADSSPTGFAVVKWGLVHDYLIETFLLVRTAFASLGADEDSMSAEKYARMVYKIVVGEESSFDKTYM
jgi:SET domain